MPHPEIAIGGRLVGSGHPPLVVAELSANHNGSLERALAHIREAARRGADAVKFQTYTAETMTLKSDRPEYRIKGGLWDGSTLFDLYEKAHTPWEWHEALFAEARALGLIPFSSPFDDSAVALLESLDTPALKVASFEAVDLALLARIARSGRPVILSTGMATLGEIEEAVSTLRDNGCRDLILLHCVSAYPAPASDANLLTIAHMSEAFGVPVGLSDHTPGTAVACAAVALGACMIEKHFILNRNDGGPDSSFSIEPPELEELARGCRMAWEARGGVHYAREKAEEANVIFRRSICAVCDIPAGAQLTPENVRAIRPGYGLAPKFLPQVIGRRVKRDVTAGEPLSWSMLT